MSDDKNKQELAKAVVDELINRIYVEMGKGFVKKLFWAVVLFIVGFGISQGFFKM